MSDTGAKRQEVLLQVAEREDRSPPLVSVISRSSRLESDAPRPASTDEETGRCAELDPISRRWVERLRQTGPRREQALAELHELLLRAARYELRRRAPGVSRILGRDFDDLAQHVADDALMAIIETLDRFRGLSRFTTWAYTFVVYKVSTALGRRAAERRSTAISDEAWERIPDGRAARPHYVAQQRELLTALGTAIDQELTDHQRRVFIAVALNDASIRDLAFELGSNSNAIYKTLCDARRKLRARLLAAGYQPRDAASAA